ncbi:MAG: lysine (K)-specific demethylase [Phylliscum demangeonii]|nr:MAG: lysine (K)-specific demethylase [Phylliscum demangeonii]
MHLEDWELFSLNHLRRGAPKRWIVVAPKDRTQMEAHMRAYHQEIWTKRCGPPRCSQFARHLSLWVPLETLALWEVPFTFVVLRAGEVIVTAPGAYPAGWNGGENVAEAINYGDARSLKRGWDCQPCHWGCDGGLRPRAAAVWFAAVGTLRGSTPVEVVILMGR